MDTANNRVRALFDSARGRLTPVTATSLAADSARCNAPKSTHWRAPRSQSRSGGHGAGGGPAGRGLRPAAAVRGRFGRPPAARDACGFGPSQFSPRPCRTSQADASVRAIRHGLTAARFDVFAKRYGVASPFPPRALTQCHDITGVSGCWPRGRRLCGHGAAARHSRHAASTRLDAVADTNFSFWHSATFSNDGSMVLFSDEWGGGGAAYCRAGDPRDWGADAIFKIVDGKMVFQSYYKLPAPQTQLENCVAHNGSLIPIPGRTIMAQAWYQGGLSVFEWTDPKHPHEIAFFDRGPNDSTRGGLAGSGRPTGTTGTSSDPRCSAASTSSS